MSRPDIAAQPARVIGRAVRRIRKYGLAGPRPIEELEMLHDLGDEALPALRQALVQASPDLLAATLHLIRLLRPAGFGDDIATAALRRPATLEAKVEAVGTLADAGLDVPQTVRETMAVATAFVDSPSAESLASVLAVPEAWLVAALEAWLEGSSATDPVLLERVLGLYAHLDPLVVSRLGDSGRQEAAEVLQRLVDDEDRALRKQAKRALHQLRRSGVIAEPVEEAGFSMAIQPDVQRESLAFVTGIDGVGGRILWILTPSPTGGERLLEAVLDDTEGLKKADVIAVTRKGFRQHMKGLAENPGILVAQIPPGEGAYLLREAEELARGQGNEPTAEYREWAGTVASQLAVSKPARDLLPAGTETQTASDADQLRESVALLGDPAFANWAVTGPAAERGAVAVRQAETSTLVVDDEQRKEQVDKAISSVADAVDTVTRQRYRRRLEDMADVLLRLKRDGEARLAAAAAVGFTEVADLYASHPFARAMIQRGVLTAYQRLREEEQREASDSRIVTP